MLSLLKTTCNELGLAYNVPGLKIQSFYSSGFHIMNSLQSTEMNFTQEQAQLSRLHQWYPTLVWLNGRLWPNWPSGAIMVKIEVTLCSFFHFLRNAKSMDFIKHLYSFLRLSFTN